jgi:hypothetical protein
LPFRLSSNGVADHAHANHVQVNVNRQHAGYSSVCNYSLNALNGAKRLNGLNGLN